VYIHYHVTDATGLEGAWDFTVQFNPVPPSMMNNGGEGARKGGAGPAQTAPSGTVPAASDPVGGISLSDAFEKQLGLKLEMRKSPRPVLVIDHIEPTPTEN